MPKSFCVRRDAGPVSPDSWEHVCEGSRRGLRGVRRGIVQHQNDGLLLWEEWLCSSWLRQTGQDFIRLHCSALPVLSLSNTTSAVFSHNPKSHRRPWSWCWTSVSWRPILTVLAMRIRLFCWLRKGNHVKGFSSLKRLISCLIVPPGLSSANHLCLRRAQRASRSDTLSITQHHSCKNSISYTVLLCIVCIIFKTTTTCFNLL